MEGEYEEGGTDYAPKTGNKASNVLPLWGNERTMNLNPLILTNIQSSHYFKVNLYELKTYHEVVDEIYYKVSHLEPWEKGSRRTSGQTGMCGGVRGVGAGGIVSTAYCLLYKLFTLKLTRKQLNGLLTHCDSPYIRALGFMYIRYTQHPQNLLDWFDPYLEDEEELDVKAGGGQTMSIGQMLRQWLIKLEWFSTLFPRIPVPIQQRLQKHLNERFPNGIMTGAAGSQKASSAEIERSGSGRAASERSVVRDRDIYRDRSGEHSFLRDRTRDIDYDRDRYRDRSRERYRSSRDEYERDRVRDRSRERDRGSRERDRDRRNERVSYKSSSSSSSKHRHRHGSRERSATGGGGQGSGGESRSYSREQEYSSTSKMKSRR